MSSERILVVDDEPENRRLLRELLDPLGYQVEEAGDGEEALASIADHVPDLVLLDLVMPRRDGYDVCRELKNDPRTRLVPVIVLTTLDLLPDKIKAIELGADDFLNKPFDTVELTTRVRSLLSLKHFTDEFEHASNVLKSIALVVEGRDRYTGDHCKRLGQYAVRIGKTLGLGQEDLETLWLGGIFHDLGKIAVSDSVLNKPAPLTPEELTVMRTHPVVGANLCKAMRTMERVLPLIRHHHEKLDGSGYPDHLAGKEIPLLVRIITAVDVYDALATARPYRKALPHETVMTIMREEVAKGWWDREIVDMLDPARSISPAVDEPVPAVSGSRRRGRP
ncbi:MAG TPA: HD domain-containing phosphohydrolase [Candidatus Polarisedimenticolia bacterium]|jgi:putative two-component system response regulator|nr:HD domain-containing phosphohydrolase [Candidatus Polarisedimenticolia bacterium]